MVHILIQFQKQFLPPSYSPCSADNHAPILFLSLNPLMKAHLESNLRSAKGHWLKLQRLKRYQLECFHERLDMESLAFSPEDNLINAALESR